MKYDDFDKKCERLQLRLTPRTLRRIRILSQSHCESMSVYIERLVNSAWDEQIRIQGFDANSWDSSPLLKVD